MKAIWILAALLWAPMAAMPVPAAEPAGAGDCEAAYAALPEGTILDLLDPAAPPERRSGALAHYGRLAEMAGCPGFGYTLGQLYRHGQDLPGNLVGQDIARARALIEPMAEAGYLPAYADMAEMVMRHGEPREAMLWTQVYLYLTRAARLPLLDADKAHFMRSAYNGHLLARAEVVWRWQNPALPRKRVKEDLNAYLAGHGEAVRRVREFDEGRGRRASAQLGTVRVLQGVDDCRLNLNPRIGAATGSWIVEVLPSGEMGRVVLENFVPRADFVEGLRACLDQYRFAPFEGARAATTRVQLVYGSPEGAQMRR